MKKKVQLSTVIKIKESLEKMILNNQEYVSKYNDTEMKVEKSLEIISLAEEALIPVKEVIQEANKMKHADGKTNYNYIYRLSNIKSKKLFLIDLKDHVTDKSQLSKSQLEDEVSKIDKEMNEIKSKLKEFNTKEVNIEITEDLNKLGLSI